LAPIVGRVALGVATAVVTWIAFGAAARAQSPAPSPSPAAPSDPCGSIASLVDRPTVATSPCTVRPRQALLENGWANTVTTGPGGGNTATYPQSFVRVGTFDPHLEFTFGPPSFSRSSVGGSSIGGWGDINLGAKYELGYTPKVVWGVGTSVSLPTGSRAFTAGNAQYTGDFNWSYAMNPTWSLAGTVSVNALSAYNAAGIAQSYFACIPSIVLTASLPQSSSFFAEYTYYSRAAPNAGAKSLIDFGVTHDLGSNVQLDAEYGDSPTQLDGQTQHYVGAGVSFLF
jgi:opacity protein-like surface antigen